MRLGDLRNILCCDVRLVVYCKDDKQCGESVYAGHIFQIPADFNDYIVLNISPYTCNNSLILLLEFINEKDRNE